VAMAHLDRYRPGDFGDVHPDVHQRSRWLAGLSREILILSKFSLYLQNIATILLQEFLIFHFTFLILYVFGSQPG
jgi:hypothetical protein